MSLRKAQEILDRLAQGDAVAVELRAPAFVALADSLAVLGIEAREIKPPRVEPRAVRERFGLSQAEFALRFNFELDTLRNWEQGRNVPDAPTQLLLKIIETNPSAVEAALTASSDQGSD